MEKIQMKIPFDIKYRPQIESGEYKVVTRDGSPVRIICWDRKSEGDGQPIVALVEKGHCEISIWVEENGVYKGTMGHEYDLLLITSEPKLTPFEQHLLVYLQKVYYAHCESQDVNDFLIGTIKQSSKSLLEFAKKEICNGCTIGLDQYWKGRDDARKEYERPITYHYDIYQPPCTHGGICTNPLKDCINCPGTTGGINISTTSGTCKKD